MLVKGAGVMKTSPPGTFRFPERARRMETARYVWKVFTVPSIPFPAFNAAGWIVAYIRANCSI